MKNSENPGMFSISHNSQFREALFETHLQGIMYLSGIKIKYETENNMNKGVFFEKKVLLVM